MHQLTMSQHVLTNILEFDTLFKPFKPTWWLALPKIAHLPISNLLSCHLPMDRRTTCDNETGIQERMDREYEEFVRRNSREHIKNMKTDTATNLSMMKLGAPYH